MGVGDDFAFLKDHDDDADFAGWLARWQALNPDGPNNGRYQTCNESSTGYFESDPWHEMECQPWLLGYAMIESCDRPGYYDWVSKDPLGMKPPLSVANVITLVKANPAAVLHKKTIAALFAGSLLNSDVPYIQSHDLILPVLNEMLMAPKDLPSSVLADCMFGLALADLQDKDYGTKLYSEPREGNKMRCQQGMLKVVTTAFALEDTRIAKMDPVPTTAALKVAFTTTLTSQTLWASWVEKDGGRYLLHEIARAPQAYAWDLAIDLIANASKTAAESRDKDGNLPVHLAAQNKFMTGPVLAAIIKANPKGAKEKGGNGDFPFPLHWMAKAEDVREQDMAAALELLPGSAKEKDSSGALPIHLAASNSTMTEPVMAALITAHPDGAKEKDGAGNLPIQLAIENCLWDLVRLLVEQDPAAARQADPNGIVTCNVHAMIKAQCPIAHIAGLLKSNPAAAAERAADGSSNCLHTVMKSVKSGDLAVAMLKTLMAANGDASKEFNKDGHLPVTVGLLNDAPTAAMAALLAAAPHGASAKDDQGRTALHHAVIVFGSSSASKEHTSKLDSTFVDNVGQLRGTNSAIGSEQDNAGRTPLHLLANLNGTVPQVVAQVVTETGAAKVQDADGKLPLHILAANEKIEWFPEVIKIEVAVQAIVEAHREGVKIKDADGMLPLHLAIQTLATTECENFIIPALLHVWPGAAKVAFNFAGGGGTPQESVLPLHGAMKLGTHRCDNSKAIVAIIDAYPEAASQAIGIFTRSLAPLIQRVRHNNSQEVDVQTQLMRVLGNEYEYHKSDEKKKKKTLEPSRVFEEHWQANYPRAGYGDPKSDFHVGQFAPGDLVVLHSIQESDVAAPKFFHLGRHVNSYGLSANVSRFTTDSTQTMAGWVALSELEWCADSQLDELKRLHEDKAINGWIPEYELLPAGVDGYIYDSTKRDEHVRHDKVCIRIHDKVRRTPSRHRQWAKILPLHAEFLRGPQCSSAVVEALLKLHPDGAKSMFGTKSTLRLAIEQKATASAIIALLGVCPEQSKVEMLMPEGKTGVGVKFDGYYRKESTKTCTVDGKIRGVGYTENNSALHYALTVHPACGLVDTLLTLSPEAATKQVSTVKCYHYETSASFSDMGVIDCDCETLSLADMHYPLVAAIRNRRCPPETIRLLLKMHAPAALVNGSSRVLTKESSYYGIERTAPSDPEKFADPKYIATVLGMPLHVALDLFATKDEHQTREQAGQTISMLAVWHPIAAEMPINGDKDTAVALHTAISLHLDGKIDLNGVRGVYAAFPDAVFVKNSAGVTPLHSYASEAQHTQTLIELFTGINVDRGINDQIAELNNKSLLALVVELGFDECADRLIKEHGASSQDAAQLAELSHNPELRQWGLDFGRLLSLYRLVPGKPKHVSPTCVVIFATQAGTDADKGETPVALKLMADKAAFMREIDQREQLQMAASNHTQGEKKHGRTFCISVIQHYADTEPGTFDKFPVLRLSNETAGQQTELRHMLVMERGSNDLTDIISHSNIAGVNVLQVTLTLRSIAESLQELNDVRDVMHGDVKGRNFVVMNDREFAAIDLDAAAGIDRKPKQLAGQKPTSSGFLPPDQAAIVLWNRRGKSGAKPNDVVASPQYDMWAFGVMAYQLVTGHQLFNYSVTEEVDDDELEMIVEWSDTSKKKKLQKVSGKFPKYKELLSTLLSKDPGDRFDNWSYVLDALPTLDSMSADMTQVLAKIDSVKTHVSMEANQTRRAIAALGETVKSECAATRKLMLDISNVTAPYLYEIVNVTKEVKERKKADGFAKKLGDACSLLGRMNSGDAVLKAAFNSANGTPFEGEKYELRLLCGVTLEPVVIYELSETHPTLAKCAGAGAKVAKIGLKVATFWNAGAGVAQLFGVPVPKIPKDQVKKCETYLTDLKRGSDQMDALNEQQDEGMDFEQLDEFAAYLEGLDGKKKAKDANGNSVKSWKDKLKIAEDPSNKGQVTFASTSAIRKVGGGEAKESVTKAKLANAGDNTARDGFGFEAGSGSHGSGFDSDSDIDNSDIDIDAASDHGLNGFGDNEGGTFGGFNGDDTNWETGGPSSSPQKTGARPSNGVQDDVAQILNKIEEIQSKLVDLEAKKRSTCILM